MNEQINLLASRIRDAGYTANMGNLSVEQVVGAAIAYALTADGATLLPLVSPPKKRGRQAAPKGEKATK